MFYEYALDTSDRIAYLFCYVEDIGPIMQFLVML